MAAGGWPWQSLGSPTTRTFPWASSAPGRTSQLTWRPTLWTTLWNTRLGSLSALRFLFSRCHSSTYLPWSLGDVQLFNKYLLVRYHYESSIIMSLWCSKHHVIKKISYNLLDLRLHFYYGTSLTILCWLINSTIKDTFLEMFYEIAGPDVSFQLWILGFLLENLGSLNT